VNATRGLLTGLSKQIVKTQAFKFAMVGLALGTCKADGIEE
jgi:hypothetical protein